MLYQKKMSRTCLECRVYIEDCVCGEALIDPEEEYIPEDYLDKVFSITENPWVDLGGEG